MSCFDLPCPPPCPPQCNCTTNDILYKGTNDLCIGFNYNDHLTDVLIAMNTFAKNRLFSIIPSQSIAVAPVLSTCNKSASITVKISEDADNALSLHTDGLYATTGSAVNVDCSTISAAFTTDTQQKNAIDPTIYDLLITGTAGCQKLSPPTGFAVAGNTRTSAFGKMEWFSTLTLANASAAANESVLIYNDTSEVLTLKTNVNYIGIGQHSVDGINGTLSTSVSNIFNLTVMNDITIGGSGYITATNVIGLGNATFSGSIIWEGGTLINSTGTKLLTITNSAKVSKIYSRPYVNLSHNGTLSHSIIDDTSTAVGAYAVNLFNGTIPTEIATISNCEIISVNNGGIFAIANQGTGGFIISNNTIKTNLAVALYVHSGSIDIDSKLIVANNTAYNIGFNDNSLLLAGAAMVVYSVSLLHDNAQHPRLNNPLITNNTAHSIDGVGIKSILGTFKECNAYSENNYGIYIQSQENQAFNTTLINCTAESKNSNALRADRDVFIAGGTYTSKWDDAAGSPIFLHVSTGTQNGTLTMNYYIAGVNTIAFNTSAFGIDANTPITARISGCNFLNEHLASAVPGINLTQITLNTVAIDASGNMK